jgi:hypothetical protein
MLRPALTLYAQIDFLSASAMTLAFFGIHDQLVQYSM